MIFDSRIVLEFMLRWSIFFSSTIVLKIADNEKNKISGNILVITEVDDNTFYSDVRFTDLLKKCSEFNNSEQVKLLIGDKEIIGRSGFKLYLLCNNKPTNLDVISNTRLLNVTPSRNTFCEFFLQFFLSHEKNRLQEDQVS